MFDAEGWHLRRAEAADAVPIRALVRTAYAKYVPAMGRASRPMTADYDAAIRDNQVWVLENDDQIHSFWKFTENKTEAGSSFNSFAIF